MTRITHLYFFIVDACVTVVGVHRCKEAPKSFALVTMDFQWKRTPFSRETCICMLFPLSGNFFLGCVRVAIATIHPS